jgi:hypothetical protein
MNYLKNLSFDLKSKIQTNIQNLEKIIKLQQKTLEVLFKKRIETINACILLNLLTNFCASDILL